MRAPPRPVCLNMMRYIVHATRKAGDASPQQTQTNKMQDATFSRALAAILSANEVERHSGEQFIERSLVVAPDQLLLGLVAHIPAPPPLCTVAAVLLRKVINREDGHVLARLSDAATRSLRAELLALLRVQDMAVSLRRKVCDVVATLGVFDIEDDGWPELMPFLFACVAGPAALPVPKENALDVFYRLSEALAHKMRGGDEARMCEVLLACALPAEALSVRAASVKAFAAIVSALDKQDPWRAFEPLVAQALDALRCALAGGEHKAAKALLENLIEVADTHPRLLEAQLPEPLLPMCMQITHAKQLPNDCRHLSLELVVALCERQPKMMRRHQPLQLLMPVLVDLIVTAPDKDAAALEAWGQRYPREGLDDDKDDDDDAELDEWGFSNLEAGLEYVDRLTQAMGHKKSLPLVLEAAAALVKEPDWRHRQGGLLVVAHVAEFVPQREPDVGHVVALAAGFARGDAHPCVRVAALVVLARLAWDCAPYAQDHHARAVLECALTCLDDAVPRVQCAAARVIDDLCRGSQNGFIELFLAAVVDKLFARLRDARPVVQEQLLAALTSVAEAADSSFAPLYSATMPTLLAALAAAPPGLLHARLCDCVSLIGVAVGKEMFRDAAPALCAALARTDLAANEALRADYLSAWMRLGSLLEPRELGAQLGKVVHDVFASTQPLRDFGYGDEDEEVDAREAYRARTAAVDDKALALQLLESFARNLQGGFSPYAQACFEVMLRDLPPGSQEHDDVRALCFSGLPSVVGVWAAAGETQLAKARGAQALEALVGALADEESTAMLGEAVLATGELAMAMPRQGGEDAFTHGDLEALLTGLGQVLQDSLQRRAVAWAERTVDGDEDEDADERASDEARVVQNLATALGQLVQTHPSNFLAVFARVLGDKVFGMLAKGRLAADRRFAVFLLDDVVEHLPTGIVQPWVPQIVPALVDACATHDTVAPLEDAFDVANLNQAGAYGIGVCAERFAMEPHAQQCYAALRSVVAGCPAELYTYESGFGHASDNAVAAMGKLARSVRRSMPEASASMLAEWQSRLPLRFDEDESRRSVAALLDMLEAGDASADARRAVLTLCATLCTDLMARADEARAVAQLQRLRSAMGEHAFAAVGVPADDVARIEQALKQRPVV